jgi:hypothetical protein
LRWRVYCYNIYCEVCESEQEPVRIRTSERSCLLWIDH